MFTLHALFWLLLFFFAAVGAIRGWVREILVTMSLTLALIIITFFPNFKNTEPGIVYDEETGAWAFMVPWRVVDDQANPEDFAFPEDIMARPDGQQALRSVLLWRVMVIVVLAFFGYETTGLSRFAARLGSTRPQERVLGVFLGALNGYLLVGSLWYYVAAYGYPLSAFEPPSHYGLPEPNVLRYMAPFFLPYEAFGVPVILLAFILLLIFVLIALL